MSMRKGMMASVGLTRGALVAVTKMMKLVVMVVMWYATSVWCGYTSKLLLLEFKAIGGSRNAELLSLFQFMGSSCCAWMFARWSDGEVREIPSEMASWKLWRVAAAFSFGFTFVNSTFSVTSIAMAETLRALEPVSTVLLGLFFLGENISTTRILTLVPIVLGAALASASSLDFNWLGLMLAMAANVSFSLRSVFVKDFKASTGGTPLTSPATFFYIVSRGIPMQIATIICLNYASSVAVLASPQLQQGRTLLLIGTNMLCFFAYNCLSFLVLAECNVITHAVLNGFRRAATIGFSVVAFATAVSTLNIVGIVMATAGVVLYSRISAAENIIIKAAGVDNEIQSTVCTVGSSPTRERAKGYRGTGHVLRTRPASF